MREPPGATADREALKWELVELERLVDRAPHAWWCWWGGCRCWRRAAFQIIRYSPGYGHYRWPQEES